MIIFITKKNLRHLLTGALMSLLSLTKSQQAAASQRLAVGLYKAKEGK